MKRKIIVSTNVAETSLTIDGVRVVIDGGLARVARFDPHRGINTLLIEKISRASAQQRLGRAGRTAPGHGVRLWTEREHEQRAAQTLPEIRRLELSGALLTLKASGIDDLENFPWVERPEVKSFIRGMQLLHDLGALDRQHKLTSTGRRMASFPTHPRYARMLLAGAKGIFVDNPMVRPWLDLKAGRAHIANNANLAGLTLGGSYLGAPVMDTFL